MTNGPLALLIHNRTCAASTHCWHQCQQDIAEIAETITRYQQASAVPFISIRALLMWAFRMGFACGRGPLAYSKALDVVRECLQRGQHANH